MIIRSIAITVLLLTTGISGEQIPIADSVSVKLESDFLWDEDEDGNAKYMPTINPFDDDYDDYGIPA